MNSLNLKKIIFIQPPVSLDEIYGGLAKVGAVAPPLNLLLLAAIVREQGFEPQILDSPALGIGSEEVVRRVKESGAAYAAITAMTPHIMQAAEVADLIKQECPNVAVLLGGAHLSAVPQETMQRFAAIDFGFMGEADRSLPEFLNALSEGGSWLDVSGVIGRVEGRIVSTGVRSDKIDLDMLPLYAWDILDGYPDRYKTPLFSTHRTPATPVLTSRGCPGKCVFCFSGCHATLATYSAEYIISMLKHLKERYGIREFMLYDDNFVMFRKNLKRMLELMISEKLDLTWSCNARVDMVDEEMLTAMVKAGCWQISYGIETGNQKIMDSLEKQITTEKVAQTVAMTKKAGIRTVGYFMVGHFRETNQTIDETIEFACDSGIDDFRMSFFTPLPGTKAALHADEFGEFDNDWGKMTLFSPIFIPTGMTRDQLVTAQKRAIRKFFFRPSVVWSYFKMVKNPFFAFKGAYLLVRYITRCSR